MSERGAWEAEGSNLPPGELVHIGETRVARTRVSVIRYTQAGVKKFRDVAPDDPLLLPAVGEVTWITVDGLHDVEVIRKIGELFNLHPLVQEDIVNTRQRPKVEEYDDHLFIAFKLLLLEPEKASVESEQISIVLGVDYVISFLEGGRELFHQVVERIVSGRGRIRRLGADYLAYALMDAVIDRYFAVVEYVGELQEDIEDRLLRNADRETLLLLYGLKRNILLMRRTLWPLRDVTGWLVRGESEFFRSPSLPYLRDVYDHTIHVIEALEASRDTLTTLLDIHLTSASNRMNEIMKVLTIIATIFIPLTFLTSLYGMNFEYMPELSKPWAYPVLLGGMALVAGIMIAYFRRKGWL